jgi:hypothetical protein
MAPIINSETSYASDDEPVATTRAVIIAQTKGRIFLFSPVIGYSQRTRAANAPIEPPDTGTIEVNHAIYYNTGLC